jgi:hypothetical protein
MQTVRIVTVLWIAAIAAFGAGAAVLLVGAMGEVQANPGISIADGYWIGRLPWTPIGVSLVLGGATATLAFATAVVMVRGPWLLRILALPVLLAGGFWYFLAVFLGWPGSGACCDPSPQTDLITTAYSTPMYTIILVVVPAAVASLLALASLRSVQRPGVAHPPPSTSYISPS